ncbi:hypothetical protein BS47DRAFT_1391977 [Hydnum rufescens UP504]|uniref:non-specific serine/threonine protein kinase n=1 Tax=Hydnum rufescens UP504 TaxID=1448309 RepID=A0A9P6AZT5_9AGAM|nr:hypothetical protein BS47DRAFT_1391977 [Hydnum rufescens UP504]
MSSKAPKTRRPEDDEEAYPYVLTNEIGKGSFATVYRGYHVKNRNAVAVKTISRAILTTKLLDNLESEINILKSLDHAHITRLKDIVKAESNIYIVMDYCSGGDLSNYIRERGKVDTLQYIPEPGAAPIYYPHPKTGGLDQRMVRSFLMQLATALKFLRDRNLIHRDLKPQNLLLQPATEEDYARGHLLGAPLLKVADFGFARFLPNTALAETLCGSPLYMAPEILSYEKYDAKADLWSVGAVLYEMSVGRPPFRANNHIELLNKIKRADSRVSFPDEDPNKAGATVVPADIKQLIRLLLKRNPVERAGFEEFFGAKALELEVSPENTPISPAVNNIVAPSAATGDGMPNTSLPHSHLHNPSVKEDTSPPVEMLVGPDGEPYDPRYYVVRSRHRDKSEGSREGISHGGGENLANATPDGKAGPDASSPKSNAKHSSLDPSPLLTSVDVEGVLRQDYVLVDDTRAVEFNRVADEIEAARRKPSVMRARQSSARSAAQPTSNNDYKTNVTPAFRHTSEGSKSNNTINIDGDPICGVAGPSEPANNHISSIPPPTSPPPPFATSYRRGTDGIPKRDFSFPPAPQMANGTALATPLIIKPPASALARALNIASKKLFGSPTNFTDPGSPVSITRRSSEHTPSSLPASPRHMAGRDLEPIGYTVSAAENDLLGQLEGLARKAHVLAEWADKKFEKVEATPSSWVSFLRKQSHHDLRVADGEAPHRADSRRKREIEAETHAVQCVSLYLTVMSFSQKAIDLIRAFYQRDESQTPSPGIDDGNRSMDKVNTLKTWLPEGYSPRHMWIDRVIYDHALSLLRHAASKELLSENFRQCEEEYEKALWMLYAIQDDVLQAGNPYAEQDRKTISNFVTTTRARLSKLQQQLNRKDEAAGTPPSYSHGKHTQLFT